jgi:arabinofuranosyltransferase
VKRTTARPWRAVRWVLLLVALGYGIRARILYFDWCIHDDAFISFRYARNLVRGAGLVMNPGERVEGITNFLWTLLSAPPLLLGADPAKTAQLLGAALGIGLMVAVFVFTEKRLGAGWYSIVTPAFLAFNMAFVMESLSGLETMAFASLVFAAYVIFLEERRDAGRRPGLWGVWCGVATLVRPEGALIFGLLGAWSLVGVWRGEPASRLRRAAFVYALLVLPLEVFRVAYYGALLPNTFYAKVGYTAAQFLRGARYTMNTFVFTITVPLLAVALVLSLPAILGRTRDANPPPAAGGWTRWFAGRPRDEAIGLALLLVGAYVAYVWIVGGDYEPTGRFHMPVLILLYLLFQEGLRTFVCMLGRVPSLRLIGALIALAACALVFAQSEQRFLTVLSERRWPASRREHNEQLRGVGEWLRDHTAKDAVIAVSSIGALPYYADRPVIDMMGLTDKHIGHRKMATMGTGASGHEKGDGDYVLQRRPDIILFDKGHLFPTHVTRETILQGARGVSETALAQSPEFARDYELHGAHIPIGYFYWFERVAH